MQQPWSSAWSKSASFTDCLSATMSGALSMLATLAYSKLCELEVWHAIIAALATVLFATIAVAFTCVALAERYASEIGLTLLISAITYGPVPLLTAVAITLRSVCLSGIDASRPYLQRAWWLCETLLHDFETAEERLLFLKCSLRLKLGQLLSKRD